MREGAQIVLMSQILGLSSTLREPCRAEVFRKDGEPHWDRGERAASLLNFTLALLTNIKSSCFEHCKQVCTELYC